MNIMEYIKAEKDAKGIGYADFAKALGISSQRFYQLLRQKDCRFLIVREMLNVLGKDIDLEGKDGEAAEIDVEVLLDTMDSSSLMFKKAKKLIEAAGFSLYIIDRDKAHDRTKESEKILI